MISKEKELLELNIKVPQFDGLVNLLGLSVKIFFLNFWFITKVIVIVCGPLEFLKYHFIPDVFTDHFKNFKYTFWIGVIVNPFIYLMIIYGVVSKLRSKNKLKLIDVFHFGFNYWITLWVKTMKSGFFISFGLLLFVVPGILLLISYLLLAPVVCFEDDPQKDPVTRCRELSIGHRRLIFGAVLISDIIGLFLNAVFNFIVFLIFDYFGAKIIGNEIADTFGYVFSALPLISIILIYLKIRKEQGQSKELWLLKWAP